MADYKLWTSAARNPERSSSAESRAASSDPRVPSDESPIADPDKNQMPTTIRTIDAHTAGEPLRLIVEGFPTVQGRTILEKRAWVEEHCDHLRTALMLEPRGHADMSSAHS